MNNKVILDLCGGTGAWSRPYREAGYDVRVVTLPDFDILATGHDDTFLIFRNADRTNVMTIPFADVYGILAAPPCTEFSLAKGNASRDFQGGIKVVEACLKIIWQCRINGSLRFWAMENPRGYLRQFLGRPQYTFEHWYFEQDTHFIKPTDLWGYYNPPKQTNFKRPHQEIRTRHAVLFGNPPCPEEYEWLNKLPYAKRRAAIRAITPRGFAEAFYRANR
ncbi:MAG TPA: DNA cytosine methyltransferase [Clostridiales bacterium]|nr:DNA cytosine methyltransferase [Clostridiales bacterium]